jgi:hypothetical protein
MKSFAKAMILAASVASATSANATVSVSAATGCTSYCGPTPITYNFNTLASTPTFVGGSVVGPGTTSNAFAAPVGGSGLYYSVGPSTSHPGTITLGSNIGSFSFIWGSIDTFNSLSLITAGGTHTYSGSAIAALVPAPANGSQVILAQNPIVTFLLSGLDQTNVRLRLNSSQNAFEIDDIAVSTVPEPGTWAMMLVGFGALGFAMRRRNGPKALTQLA